MFCSCIAFVYVLIHGLLENNQFGLRKTLTNFYVYTKKKKSRLHNCFSFNDFNYFQRVLRNSSP